MRMPTAQHWLHRARLQDRRSVLIRRVCRHDALSLQGFVSALDAQSRYQRFFIPLRELTAAMLERLTQPDQRIGCALIALAGREEVAGVVQYQLIEHNEAEAAVVVGQRWRRVGLASLLLSDLAIVAAANGVQKVRADILRGNDAAVALARNVGCVIDTRVRDAHAVHVVRQIGTRGERPDSGALRSQT